jgi:hypothetical protein
MAVMVLTAGVVFADVGFAASAGPAWEISSVAHPLNFSMEDNAKCARAHLRLCDQYLVTLTNVGARPTSGGLVTIDDALPVGLKLVGVSIENMTSKERFGCGMPCEYGNSVQPGTTLAVFVEVEVEETAPIGEGTVTNKVIVSGGGAPSVATSAPLTLANTIGGSPAAFGISAFGFAAHDESGSIDMQAGDHPLGVTGTVSLNTFLENHPLAEIPFAINNVEPVRDVVTYLPLGMVGTPLATTRCTELQFDQAGSAGCPPASRVGQVATFDNVGVISSTSNSTGTTSIYNMVPDAGYAAQFGFKTASVAVPLYASVVYTPAGYRVRVATPGVPRGLRTEGAALSFFGDPRTADGEPNSSSQAFFTNPDDCSAGPLMAEAQVDSWANPGQWVTEEATAYPGIAGCGLLQFEPTVEMHPEVTQAEAPSGYEIKIKVPQSPDQFPILATPQLKNVTMTLPEGMTISPGGGDGLVGCEASGPNGIDMPTNLPGGGRLRTPTEAGEGEEIGPDGMTHLVPGHCPRASQIGTVRITTPVLEQPLEGRVYVAQPRCGGPGQPICTDADATNGNLYGLYLEAGDPRAGVVIKLAASASVDPATGRLTARFLENPQFPVSEVAVQLKGGPRAPLANPRQCGAASVNADLTPWSSPMTPDAIIGSPPFTVDWDGSGGPCPATLSFAPSLVAGPTRLAAGGFSPLTLTLTRGDRQQDLRRLQVKLPSGLLGMLSKVSLCGEPQAAQGACGQASEVGSTWVAAGSGSRPLWVRGRVYLTGPYGGAPFGLSVVVPAVTGPFNLGNVVVRSRIDIDPHTSAITITSAPLPQFLDGVPLRIQTVNVAVQREGFTFNPTNCEPKQIATTLEAEQGATASPSASFAAEGCRGLPFKPTFSVSTQGHTSKKSGASLDVRVTSGPGQTNIAGTVVSLPKQLPARLTTLQQACPEATFAANPAACPAGSDVGTAKAVTPVLNEPLSGPAYLVSHGGAAFPDLVIVLEGQGIRLDLTGGTSIRKGITTSTFKSVPDAPITSFEVKLPEGPHSALTATLPAKARGSLCGAKLVVPTTLTGQNGAQIKQSTKVAVSGCPKARARRARGRRAAK